MRRYYFEVVITACATNPQEALAKALGDSANYGSGQITKTWDTPLDPQDWDRARVDEKMSTLNYPSMGSNTEEFSNTPCWLCARPLAGARHDLTYIGAEGWPQFEWVCTDCRVYIAYGDPPDNEV